MNSKIAIVEDDQLIASMVKFNLDSKHYQTEIFVSAEALLDRISHTPFDLIILDIRLPGRSGIDLLKVLRQSSIQTPVLITSVYNQAQTRVTALDLGADDYLVKPFDMDELLARVNALIRRSQGRKGTLPSRVLVINGFEINLLSRLAESSQGAITLSEKEINLLKYLAGHVGVTLDRGDILEEVWGMEVDPTPRTIDNFIVKFRKLFENDPALPRHFITVRNRGYRFEF